MKKKGFTLVELLAVIVILAIIALIATPLILNVIEDSEKGTFKSSVYGIIESAELYSVLNPNESIEQGIVFTCNGTSCKNGDKELSIKGQIPTHGTVTITKNGIEVENLSNGKFCAKGTKDLLDIQKDCESLDTTPAVIDESKLTISSTTNEINIEIQDGFAIDNESGIKEYIVTLTDKEEKKISSIGNVKFTGLENDKEYEIKIVVVNGNGINSNTIIKKIITGTFSSPTCVVPTGYSQSKTVECIYESGYTNEYSLDNGVTWTSYTDAITFTSNGTIKARISDGTNILESENYEVTDIDTTSPNLALSKIAYQEGFDGWTLESGMSIDSNGYLVIETSGKSAYNIFQVNGEKWYATFEAYTTSTSTQYSSSGKGGVYAHTMYYNSNNESVKSQNGYSANGFAGELSLNTWENKSYNGHNGYGTDVMYVNYQIGTISPYSAPTLKIRNFKLSGQLYASTYTINVSSSDDIGISKIKYEKGVYDKEYFKTNGITGSGSIVVDSNGTYTVYVEDLAGNGTVATIDIDKIV